jgi:hypothetical protein
MSVPSVPRTSPVLDLLRLAIPVVLIAGAVVGTLWIDRSTGFDTASVETPSATSSSAR